MGWAFAAQSQVTHLPGTPPVEAVSNWDALAQPQPEYVFDQQVQW